ncbi:MAG: glycosyltransferase [Gammaproteobacteria bacterium]
MHLVDITMFYTPHSGGVRRYLLDKRAWLARHTDVRHTLLVPAHPCNDMDTGIVQQPAMPLPLSRGYRFPLRTTPWEKTLVDLRPDIIETGDPYRLAWAALDAGRRLRAPVIGFYHSDTRRVLRALFGARAGPLIDRYIRWLYNRFDLVLAPSVRMCASLRRLGVAKVERQRLGIDTGIFHPARRDPALRTQLGLPETTRLLIYAGRAHRDKNIDLLIEAITRLGGAYHLLLVGHGSDTYARANVTCLPHQHDRRALSRLLASSDALVHAGNAETFGLIAAEAMACGIPVVAPRKSPVAELIDHTTGIGVTSADTGAYQQAIRTLYETGPRRLGENARRRAEQWCDWNATMPALLDRYAGLIRRRSVPSPPIACVASQ